MIRFSYRWIRCTVSLKLNNYVDRDRIFVVTFMLMFVCLSGESIQTVV